MYYMCTGMCVCVYTCHGEIVEGNIFFLFSIFQHCFFVKNMNYF